MLKFYLTSVLIYMIIIYSLCSILKDGIRAKGWTNDKTNGGKWRMLFMLSAVPILRFCIIILIFYMSTHTKNEFDEWYKEVQEKRVDLKDELPN